MPENNPKPTKGFDEWYNRLKEETKDIPNDDRFDTELEKMTDQIESGDYSCLGPELRKEIEERERREKKKRVAKPREKEKTPTV